MTKLLELIESFFCKKDTVERDRPRSAVHQTPLERALLGEAKIDYNSDLARGLGITPENTS